MQGDRNLILEDGKCGGEKDGTSRWIDDRHIEAIASKIVDKIKMCIQKFVLIDK